MRFIRGAETWSRKNRRELETIALYTAADSHTPFVKAANRAVRLPEDSTEFKTPYLDLDLLLDTAQAAGADAIWPGWGFLAEEPALATACEARGLIFLGPPGPAISQMSDKVTAKHLAESQGVPVAPWSREPVTDADAALTALDEIGYPALLKSAAGGGGRGIRKVESPADVAPAFDAAAAEALATSGNPELFIESFVAQARHIEVQILADAHGTVWTLGTRDCSVQRRNQKLIEEAPAPGLDPAVDQAIQDAAKALAKGCDYVGVGTAEFLLLPDEKTFYFMEMNARLQVEHTVTEAIYGVDLVGFQIDVAQGLDLSTLNFPTPRGVALEARLNAEDPDDHFAPRTGQLVRFSAPDGPWVRVDSGYLENNSIPSAFDSNIAKIITWGVDRQDAVARMQTALYETICATETGLSNRSLLLEIIADTPFRTGPVNTRWLSTYLPQRPSCAERQHLAVALAAAAIGDHLSARRAELRLFFGEALTGLPRRVRPPGPRSLRYLVDGQMIDVHMACLGPRRYLVECGPWEAVITARSGGANTMLLDVDGRRHTVLRVVSSDQIHIDVEGVAHHFEKVSDGKISARIPAAVNHLHVAVGDAVDAGQRLITLEAMKMEFPVNAPVAGTIDAIHVGPAESVDTGDILLELRPAADGDDDESDGPAIALPSHERQSLGTAQILRARQLGYDVADDLQKSSLNALLDHPEEIALDDLLTLWSIYVSRECLFWKGPGDDAVNDSRESSVEQLEWFVRRRRLDDQVLSRRFQSRLCHWLKLHDLPAIEAGPRLDHALLRLFQARHDRRGSDAIAAAGLQAILRRSRQLDAQGRAERLSAPFAWADDLARPLLEAFATRAANRRRWELAALTWRYIHAMDALPARQSPTNPSDFSADPAPAADGFTIEKLSIAPCNSPAVKLRAYTLDAQSTDATTGDRRLFVDANLAALETMPDGDCQRLPALERAFLEAATIIRRHAGDSRRDPNRRLFNRITLTVNGPLDLSRYTLMNLAHRLAGQTRDLDLEALIVKARQGLTITTDDGPLHPSHLVFDAPTGLGPSLRLMNAPLPIRPLEAHERQKLSAHRRARFSPFEVIDWLTGGLGAAADTTLAQWPAPPVGAFQEWDFDDHGAFAPTARPWATHEANLVVGLIDNTFPARWPDQPPAERVLIVGDATKTMGSLGEPECRRILAAFDLADQLDLPIEWVPVSAGARIAFDSGTENLDWTARVLRRIVEFTQRGGVINIIVDGPCVGAQSYWNAEATMLMHCRGTLIMTDRGYMILTGRKALEYSGSIAAETNHALGGDEIMIPNGEAQYHAADLLDAYRLLFDHYDYTQRPHAPTTDSKTRALTDRPAGDDSDLEFLGQLFDDEHNPGRKRPFATRTVMDALVDQDSRPIERWQGLQGGESAITWLARLGGHPITLIGVESQPVPRKGAHPVDGPDTWMSGTLFPQSSRKIARAISAASGVHPVVVLANLSGFDGSPESLRERQLEFGAQIARAVVNFEGPIFFNVIARYHGGAFVVFSKALNESVHVSALKGTYASVIGGAPAAAVVFPRKVDQRLGDHPEFAAAKAITDPAERRAAIQRLRAKIQAELAREFDGIHNIERAKSVGSLDDIVDAANLRAHLIDGLSN